MNGVEIGAIRLDFANAIALVSCVKRKQPAAAPARQLYISDWFLKVRALLERAEAQWFVLSALYGLVAPDKEIAPYEQTLLRMSVAERRAWADNVLQHLLPIARRTEHVVIFAGARYREFLVPVLREHGIVVDVPLEGLRIGEQLSWLTHYK